MYIEYPLKSAHGFVIFRFVVTMPLPIFCENMQLTDPIIRKRFPPQVGQSMRYMGKFHH